MRARIPRVNGDCIAATLADDRRQAALDLGERLVPPQGLEVPVPTHERGAHAVGIRVERLQRVGLRTDEAAAERVRLIAADADHLAPTGPDLQPAGGLAEWTGAVASPIP